MCIQPTNAFVGTQQQVVNRCPARMLGADQRQELAVAALAGTETITALAQEHQVSRKFVYQQAANAAQALHEAFAPNPGSDQAVLFYLPVTKAWLRQLVLALLLICHSSYRGVVELLRDLFAYDISVGTVHNIVQAAVPLARQHNAAADVSGIRIGAHDEIFQGGQPVLVGADVASTFCYLLSLEEHRDGDTGGIRLLELQDRGFQPEATIADFGSGLRAGQKLALAQVNHFSSRGPGFFRVGLVILHYKRAGSVPMSGGKYLSGMGQPNPSKSSCCLAVGIEERSKRRRSPSAVRKDNSANCTLRSSSSNATVVCSPPARRWRNWMVIDMA